MPTMMAIGTPNGKTCKKCGVPIGRRISERYSTWKKRRLCADHSDQHAAKIRKQDNLPPGLKLSGGTAAKYCSCGRLRASTAKRCKECHRHNLSVTGAERSGPKNPLWKGGRRLEKGYVKLWMGSRNAESVYRAEHRIIVEAILGRKLRRSEVVHHINGDKSDNRNCNLLVCDWKGDCVVSTDA